MIDNIFKSRSRKKGIRQTTGKLSQTALGGVSVLRKGQLVSNFELEELLLRLPETCSLCSASSSLSFPDGQAILMRATGCTLHRRPSTEDLPHPSCYHHRGRHHPAPQNHTGQSWAGLPPCLHRFSYMLPNALSVLLPQRRGWMCEL